MLFVPAAGDFFKRPNTSRPDGGEAVFVGKGSAVAASGDGSWVVACSDEEDGSAVTAYRLAWR